MTSTTSSRSKAVSTTDLALIATFAALIAVCTIIGDFSVTGIGVPFTLQMFGIFLAGAVLGAKRGALAVLLYLAVGTAGVPIFAEHHGGPSVWVGVTGGYLLAFPIAAFIVGLVASRVARTNPASFAVVVSIAAAIVTVAVVGTLGTLGMSLKLDVSLKAAWGYATPFFVADIVKGVLAAIVAAAVHRAFPQLVAKR
jgi:biotin transport system substrate-specific component